jgi:NDP-sugar pyrophosphorylase family protein
MAAQLRRRSRLPARLVVTDGRLVDVEVDDADVASRAALVMAGGRGKRLRPLTDKVPKPLLKVGTETIIERIMRTLVEAGVQDLYLALNYKAKMFEKRLGTGEHLGARLHYIHEETPLGTGGALGLLPTKPKGPLLVTNADIITRLHYARLFEFHERHGDAVTMTAVEQVTHVPYGVLRTRRGRLEAQEEKPEIKTLCNAGMYVLEPRVLSMVKKGRPLDMPALLDKVMAKGDAVHVFPVTEKWIDSGTPEEFQRVLIEFATGEEE